MTTQITITLATQSRYKDTTVLSTGGIVEFALWNPPLEFTVLPIGSTTHIVRKNEIGMLDALAVKYFGPGTEVLWWTIAQANGIQDPEIDMYPGQVLTIPPRSSITSFTARAGLANA
jgi:hypothetical protein